MEGYHLEGEIVREPEAGYTDGRASWTITNKPGAGDFHVVVEWMDAENRDGLRPDVLNVQLVKRAADATGDDAWEDVADVNPLQLTKPTEGEENVGGIGYWKGTFTGVVKEAGVVYGARSAGGEKNGDIVRFDDNGAIYGLTYDDSENPAPEKGTYTQHIILTAKKEYSVVKDWVVDTMKTDVPSELGVILQQKTGTEEKDGEEVDKYSDEPTATLKLNATDGWKGTFKPVDRYVIKEDKTGESTRTVTWEEEEATYRVREMTEAKLRAKLQEILDGATEGLPDEVKKYIDDHKPVDSVLDWASGVMEGSDVPDAVKSWAGQYLQDNIPEDGGEILLDIPASGTNSAHQTKYLVSYEEDGNTTTITNTAILDITIYKKWLMFGSAKDKIPDSVYLILLARSIQPEGSEASSDTPFANTYLPVHKLELLGGGTLIDGDMIDLPLVGKVLAIGEAKGKKESEDGQSDTTSKAVTTASNDGDDDDKEDEKEWQVSFRVRKYDRLGLEQEFKGAELMSGSISTVANIALNCFGLGSLANIANYISFNPVNGYLSVSHKAVKIPSWLPVVGDDSKLYSVVVNTWVGFDPSIGGVKEWDDDENSGDTRPKDEYGNVKPVTLHVYEDGTEITTVTVGAETYWTWALTEYDAEVTDEKTGETKTVKKKIDSSKTYTVKEDPVPEGYVVSYDGLNVTNALPTLTVTNTVYNSGEGNNPEFTYTAAFDSDKITELRACFTRQGGAV